MSGARGGDHLSASTAWELGSARAPDGRLVMSFEQPTVSPITSPLSVPASPEYIWVLRSMVRTVASRHPLFVRCTGRSRARRRRSGFPSRQSRLQREHCGVRLRQHPRAWLTAGAPDLHHRRPDRCSDVFVRMVRARYTCRQRHPRPKTRRNRGRRSVRNQQCGKGPPTSRLSPVDRRSRDAPDRSGAAILIHLTIAAILALP